MRRFVVPMLILLALAACQPAETPAPPPTSAAEATPEAAATLATVEPTLAVQQREPIAGLALPIPGTAIVAAATEDPFAGMVFERILFERTGGDSEPLTIELLGDGSFTRNGAPGNIGAAQVQELTGIVDRMAFFDLQGIFVAAGTSAEIYQYSITVDRQGMSRTIDAQDGLIPPQLEAFITILANIGAG
jgi:hypothetical protein